MGAALILLLSISNLFAQVDTEAMRKSEFKEGLTGTGSFNANIVQGNMEFFILETQLRFDYRKNKYHTFLIGNMIYGKLDSDKFIDKGFIHARLVRSLNSRIGVEAFAQSEFNDFLNINRRQLAGGGLRLLLLRSGDRLTLHLGIAAIYEGEDYTDPAEEDKYLIRSTNYLTGKLNINESVTYSITGYFQPDTKDPSDFRILVNTELGVKLSKMFSFTAKVQFRHDSEPLRGLKDYDISISNGISFTF